MAPKPAPAVAPAVAPAPADATIEVLADATGEVWHSGTQLKPGAPVRMSPEQAARHVAAGHAKIVSP